MTTANIELEAKRHEVIDEKASKHKEKGRGHGLSLIFFVLEQSKWTLMVFVTVISALFTIAIGGGWITFLVSSVVFPVLALGVPVFRLVTGSWVENGACKINAENFYRWKDPKKASKWRGKKVPMERFYEAYMAGEIELKQDMYEVLLKRNKLFAMSFTRGDIVYYFKDMLGQKTGHTVKRDHSEIAHVYDRGNDFYNWFLGDTMIYTSGMYRDRDEPVEVGQRRKLETVCKYVQMKPGDRHLDLGCGWGTLISHSAKECGAKSTGITLSKEQAAWGRETAEKLGVSDRVEIIVDDYRNLPARKWDKITCLEMAEHVGIKNFQTFLLQVKSMLEDDGMFYLQIAGLRRSWQYEDLVWGLFMSKYIFPGADASCPLGFVTDQMERAGFEVHRVENMGVHYSLTIKKWYDKWMSNKDAVIAKYGERWFRTWEIFLGWSAIIAAQGSSTVFMVTATKNLKNDKDSVDSLEAKDIALSRTDKFVGPDPVASQQ